MINLEDIYKKTLSKEFKNTCIGDIFIKLITEVELDELMNKRPYEQIAYCILDKEGERHFSDDVAIKIKQIMPMAHQDELCDLIMKANKFGVIQEETEKN
jgi:hypothetical protein